MKSFISELNWIWNSPLVHSPYLSPLYHYSPQDLFLLLFLIAIIIFTIIWQKKILRMIIMQMPRGRVGSYAIRKIFLTKVFHLRLDHRWKDFRGRRDFPLAQQSFTFSFLKVEIPAKEFALPLWGWPGFWNLFKNCCALSSMLFDNRKFSTFRLIHLIGHKRISGICRILQILDFICAQIGIKSISYTFGLIKLIGSV